MGGDNAPAAPVLGAAEFLRSDHAARISLAGDLRQIEPLLSGAGDIAGRVSFVDAPETITNHESPAMAVRLKKRSPVVLGMLSVRAGETGGFVSAGSTGAVLLGAMLRLGRIPGIERPALAVLIPNGKGRFLLIDSGANMDCRPEWLLQFGVMGDAYMRVVAGVSEPRVGLVNVGDEMEKGSALYKQAHLLMRGARYRFAGNIEGRYITADRADVIVCDGFDGNLILKFMEGVADTLLGIIKNELMADTRSKLGAAIARPAFRRAKRVMDYSEVGGAPLLGVQGAVVKAHGSSTAHAFACALRQTAEMVRANVAQTIQEQLA